MITRNYLRSWIIMPTQNVNHYKWLDKHLQSIFDQIGLKDAGGIASAHGDKFYSYKDMFEEAGLHFAQGVAIGLISYEPPYSSELRMYDRDGEWINFGVWFRINHLRFLKYLPDVDMNDPDILSNY
jgi:hypothetical protein